MKAPIFEKLRKNSESSQTKSKPRTKESSESLADARTNDNSPLSVYQSNSTFGNKTQKSKISSRLTKTLISPLDLQSEYYSCQALNTQSIDRRIRSFQVESSSTSIDRVQDFPSEVTHIVKVYYIIPEEYLSELELASLKQIADQEKKKNIVEVSVVFKYGCVIRHVSIKIKGDRLVDELLSIALVKINGRLRSEAFSYCFKDDISCFSFRSSKKIGFPDFDLPAVYEHAKVGDLYMKKLSLCYGSSEDEMTSRVSELLVKESVPKTPVIVPKCKCIIF